jgi:cell division protease FtsH
VSLYHAERGDQVTTEPRPALSERDIDRSVARLPEPARLMPSDIRDTLSWLAHLLDGSLALRVAEDADEFARRHLGTGAAGVVAIQESLGPFSASLVARAFAAELQAHPPYEVAGLVSDESPSWERLDLDGTTERVPSALVAAFAAGTLLDPPAVVSIDTRWSYKRITVQVRAGAAAAAEDYLRRLVERAREEHNHLRGRCLQVGDEDRSLSIQCVPPPAATRADVIVPDPVWAEIDLNVSALFARRQLLTDLGLGTNRGLLLVGPPGTGKSAVCRVLAAELVGAVTVLSCSAMAIAAHLGKVYAELTRLGPALVLLEDIDLVVGTRSHGQDIGLHDFLTALDGAMSRHRDVVTVATTNDVRALDDAAVRAARFDRVVELPLPDATLRAAILRRYLGPLAARVEVTAVAAVTGGASGADLRELVRRSVLADGADIGTGAILDLVRTGAWAATAPGMYL